MYLNILKPTQNIYIHMFRFIFVDAMGNPANHRHGIEEVGSLE